MLVAFNGLCKQKFKLILYFPSIRKQGSVWMWWHMQKCIEVSNCINFGAYKLCTFNMLQKIGSNLFTKCEILIFDLCFL